YRQVLGRQAVSTQSVLDKLPMTWRLMKLLPGLLERPGFEPLAGFLRQGGMDRRLQLAERLADLYDQYQLYRSDWLAAWAAGQDILPRSAGDPAPTSQVLPPEQIWQSSLWRELLAQLSEPDRASTRSQLHLRLQAALDSGVAPVTPIARRVVVFGMTHIPMQTLQALAALSQRCQVLLAIPNPCRYHWADIIQRRELLQMERRRHPLRKGRDLAAVSLEEMHAHAHPLLAAWGRQGRDFVRQLDAFDDALQAQQHFAVSKVAIPASRPSGSPPPAPASGAAGSGAACAAWSPTGRWLLRSGSPRAWLDLSSRRPAAHGCTRAGCRRCRPVRKPPCGSRSPPSSSGADRCAALGVRPAPLTAVGAVRPPPVPPGASSPSASGD
ncbi:MAG: exodeoxyribonuclease V subunit gamma, partial [Burkholderiales bacterium]|nr:exodeoxyribonuclease V subunit gamma [Burkholderiales bacterium]